MSQLAEDYFKRDLSEAEEATLAEELKASPELAERFASLAESDYRRLGVPLPSRPSYLKPLAMAGLLGLGLVAWWVHESPPAERPNLAIEGGSFHAVGARPGQESSSNGASVPRLEVSPGPAGGFEVRLSSGLTLASGEVRDAQGRKVAALRSDGHGGGIWDGKAAPGRYRIVAGPSDGEALSKWVEIEESGH